MTVEMRKEVIGNATLYLGDCRDILPTLDKVDAVVTDPPYGVAGGSGTIGRRSQKTKYTESDFSDTRDSVRDVFVPAVSAALAKSSCGIVTPGSPNAWLYPEPDDLGFLFQPANTGMTKWGRATCQPVLFYGKDPKAGKTIKPIHKQSTTRAPDVGHPCPKPDDVSMWMIDRASVEGNTILDPFMGSGSFGVAAVQMGRLYVGIEISPKYFDIACKRIEDAQRQGDLFV